MGVRKEGFARAKVFELWGTFERNFDLFSQKCWQILTSTRGAKSAPTRETESELSKEHIFVTNTARIISSSFYL
jgi:hypothetical protein